MKFKMIIAAILAILMVGCATQPLKAPCNEYATYCGSKTKINQW